jgi:thioredoxin 1
MAVRYTGAIMGLLEKLFGITAKKPPFSVNDTNFEAEVLGSALPVLLDVWGPSCGPCKQLEPVIMDLCAFYDGRVKVCELSAQASPRVTALLKVSATPTVLYFLRGEELERIHGFRSSLFHKQTIQDHFGIAH